MARKASAPAGATPRCRKGLLGSMRGKVAMAVVAVVAAFLCVVGVSFAATGAGAFTAASGDKGGTSAASAETQDVSTNSTGVYAFITRPDDSKDEYTLVIKNGMDQPTGYGSVEYDWSSEANIGADGVAIDLTNNSYGKYPAQGGVYAPSSKTAKGYVKGLYGYAYPWRWDKNVDMTKITKVVVPLDSSGYVSGVNTRSLFAGLVNCEEFDLTGLDTTGYEGYYTYSENEPDHNGGTYSYGMFGFYDLALSWATDANPKGSYPTGSGVWPVSSTNNEIAANVMCKSVKKIITGDKWTLCNFPGLFSERDHKDYCNNSKYATTFYLTVRTDKVVARTPMMGAYMSKHSIASPMFANYLPSGKHVYYTSEADATANQSEDYKFCYGDAVPSSFKDSSILTKQPTDVAGYTGTNVSWSSLEASIEVSTADGLPLQSAPVWKWYLAKSYSDQNPTEYTGTGVGTSGSDVTVKFYKDDTPVKTSGVYYLYADAYADNASTTPAGRTNIVKLTSYAQPEKTNVEVESSSSGQDSEYPVQYLVGESADALTVNANKAAAELKAKYDLTDAQVKTSYQWYKSYKGGSFEAIDGATAASYTPETRIETGEYVYYCSVSLTISTYARTLTQVTYTGDSPKFYLEIDAPEEVAGSPEITSVSMSDATYEALPDNIAELSIKATVPHGTTGEFKYQWFANGKAVSEKAYVPEDGNITFAPLAGSFGTTEYYCVVTNQVYTNLTGEDRVKTATSDTVTVTIEGTVHVKTAADMLKLKEHQSDLANGYNIVLDNDIDLSADENTKSWSAITLENCTFDGDGHTISGIDATSKYFDDSIDNYTLDKDAIGQGALFGSVIKSTVKNLTVDGKFASAGIAAVAVDSTIEGCVVKGAVNPNADDHDAAGVVVKAAGTTFKNCGNEASVSAKIPTASATNYAYAAGILAHAVGVLEMTGCYNAGNISAFNVSGLVAYIQNSSATENDTRYAVNKGDALIEDCYNVGALVSGYSIKSRPWSTDPVSAGLAYAPNGKTAGEALVMKSCFNAGDMTVLSNTSGYTPANTYAEAIASVMASSNATDCYYLSTLSAKAKTIGTAVESNELAADDMVSTLNGDEGTTWKAGALYPMLSWQNGTVAGVLAPVVTDAAQTTIAGTRGTAYDPITITADYKGGLKDAYKGILSYQWYERVTAEDGTVTDTAIENANTNSYTPSDSEVGERYYFCRVTNTVSGAYESTDSALYTVNTLTGYDAATPTFDNDKPEASFVYADAKTVSAAVNNADADGMGTLTYQWKSRTYKDDGTYTDSVIYPYMGYDAVNKESISLTSFTNYAAGPVANGYTYLVCTVTNTFEGKTATADIEYKIYIDANIEISSTSELKAWADTVSSTNRYTGVNIKLTNDLDLAVDPATANWTPIPQFGGTFDGQGHTIKGLNVNSSATYVGFFGMLYSGSTVKNLNLSGSVTGTAATAYVGGLAGATEYNPAKAMAIQNVCSNVTVNGGGYTGGILGYANNKNNITIDGCSNWGNVKSAAQSSTTGSSTGGILGYSCSTYSGYKVVITNCYNRGDITSTTMNHNYSGVGGIVGMIRYSGADFKNCYNTGNVTALDGTSLLAAHIGPIYGWLPIEFTQTNLDNNYYLAGSAKLGGTECYGTNGTATGQYITSKTEDEMKSTDLVASLGSAFKQGNTYPILAWETAEAGSQVKFITQPVAESAYALNQANVTALTVAVEGEGAAYQWYSNTSATVEGATEISGATTASCTPSVSAAGETWYFCKVTLGDVTSNSSLAHVYVASATPAAELVFTTQPKDIAVTTGEEATQTLTAEAGFAAGATEGKGDITYQWYKMAGKEPAYGSEDSADEAIEGATETSYIPATDATASYYVVATNTFEKAKKKFVVSNAVTVTCVNEVIEISSVDELIAFRDSVNNGNTYAGKTVSVKKGTYDISNSKLWNASIGYTTYNSSAVEQIAKNMSFKGVFEGNGSTFILSNGGLAKNNQFGLFGRVDGGELNNFTVKGCVTASSDANTNTAYADQIANIGVVVNYVNAGKVTNVTVEGSVKNYNKYYDPKNNAATVAGVGCVAGKAVDSSFCNVDVDATSEAVATTRYGYTGGVAGIMQGGSLENVVVAGNIKHGFGHVGGVVGLVSGKKVTMTQVVNKANVTNTHAKTNYSGDGDESAGGIIGEIASGGADINGAINSGDIAGYDVMGGIIGIDKSGLCKIHAAYNSGNVTYSTQVSTAQFGGLAGNLVDGSTITSSYNVGTVVPCSANAGGLLGSGNSANVSNCYYTSDSYPKDIATGQSGDSLETLTAAGFAATLDADGCFFDVDGSTPALWFETPRSLSDSNVSLSATEVPYAGKATSPEVTVTFSIKGEAKTLVEGTDYELTYENNDAIGEAKVIVTGKGEYTGKVEKTFTVARGKLVIAAPNAVKRAGQADPDFTATAEGLASSDELASVKFKREGGDKAGTYTLTPASAIVVSGKTVTTDAYDVTYAAGTLEVVDASALEQAIAAAKAAGSGSLNDAIAKAQAVYDDMSATGEQVSKAASELNAAVQGMSKASNGMSVKAKAKAVKVKAKKAKKKAVSVKAITVTGANGTVTFAKVGKSAKLSINAKTGKVKVKKGTKKGTYKIKVKVTAAGDATHASATKTITVKVKVK